MLSYLLQLPGHPNGKHLAVSGEISPSIKFDTFVSVAPSVSVAALHYQSKHDSQWQRACLLILGHPSENSFCKPLLDAYQNGAESAGANIKTIYVSRLNFKVTLSDGYKNGTAMQLEDDLIASQELIQWADHVVMAYPKWWGFMPAVTKVLLTGYSSQALLARTIPENISRKAIERKSIRFGVICWLWIRKMSNRRCDGSHLIYRASQYQILQNIVLGYVGFDPVRFSDASASLRKSTDALRNRKWLEKSRATRTATHLIRKPHKSASTNKRYDTIKNKRVQLHPSI